MGPMLGAHLSRLLTAVSACPGRQPFRTLHDLRSCTVAHHDSHLFLCVHKDQQVP